MLPAKSAAEESGLLWELQIRTMETGFAGQDTWAVITFLCYGLTVEQSGVIE